MIFNLVVCCRSLLGRKAIGFLCGLILGTMMAPAVSVGQEELVGDWWDGFDLQGMDGPVLALSFMPEPIEDLGEFTLVAGGNFTWAGDVHEASYLARHWNYWASIQHGIPSANRWLPFNPGGPWNAPIHALLQSWELPAPNRSLVIGGAFTASTGQPYDYIAEWVDTGTGERYWRGMPGLNSAVTALTRDASGQLIVGGYFESSEPDGLHFVARWTGSGWDNMLGGLPGPVSALCTLESGELLATTYTEIDQGYPPPVQYALYNWNGGPWTDTGFRFNAPVLEMCSLGNRAYIGGAFSAVQGDPTDFLAVYEAGILSPLMTAGEGPNGPVHAITVYAANGVWIVVGGVFTEWGGAPCNHIAAFYEVGGDEYVWNPLTTGVEDGLCGTGVYSLVNYRQGIGSDGPLVAGGDFRIAGGFPSYFIGLWDEQLAGNIGEPSRHSTAVQLSPLSPNPSRGEVGISYALSSADRVRLTAHDALGRRVSTLIDANRPAGRHWVSWGGVNTEGAPLVPGVYFLRLHCGSEIRTQRVVLIH